MHFHMDGIYGNSGSRRDSSEFLPGRVQDLGCSFRVTGEPGTIVQIHLRGSVTGFPGVIVQIHLRCGKE